MNGSQSQAYKVEINDRKKKPKLQNQSAKTVMFLLALKTYTQKNLTGVTCVTRVRGVISYGVKYMWYLP